MNHRKNTGHSVSSLFSLLLFGVFVLFLILMLLFSARIYQQTVKQTDSDSELGTAATYLTTKFRQHDRGDEIFSGSLDDIPALCFRDDIKRKEYITYIYLKNDSLMELFTAKGSQEPSSHSFPISGFRKWKMVFTTFPWKVPRESARNSCFIALAKRRHHERIKT